MVTPRLLSASAVALVLLLGACGSSDDSGSGADPTTTTAEGASSTTLDTADSQALADRCVDDLYSLLADVDFDDEAAVTAVEAEINGLSAECSAVDSAVLSDTLTARSDELSDAAYEYVFQISRADAEAADVTGDPCVDLAAPLPEGTPELTMPVGPPPTELVVEDLVEGDGPVVEEGATVEVDYAGVACSTGVLFDSSYERGTPVEFPLDGVIPGWTEGLLGMKVGGTRLLVIPPDLGYGATGSGEDIAPGETLVFVIELNSVS